MTGKELKKELDAMSEEQLDLAVLIELQGQEGYCCPADVVMVRYRGKDIAIAIKEA